MTIKIFIFCLLNTLATLRKIKNYLSINNRDILVSYDVSYQCAFGGNHMATH